MVGAKTPWRAFKGFASKMEPLIKGFMVPGLNPLFGLFVDSLPYGCQRLGSWMPDACRQKQLGGAYMKIKTWRMGVFGLSVPKLNACMGFIGCFVLGKAGISINAKQRPAITTGICSYVRRDHIQGWCHGLNETLKWRNHHFQVPFLVFLEPGPLIIMFQVFKELKEPFVKSLECC